MDRINYESLKNAVSTLNKFTNPDFFPASKGILTSLQGEVLKEREVIDGIKSILHSQVAERNAQLIQEAEKDLERAGRCLESISVEGLFVRDEAHESAIKAENEFRIAESMRARKSRCITVTSGEVIQPRSLLERRRDRGPLSGGDLGHKTGNRVFEPYQPRAHKS